MNMLAYLGKHSDASNNLRNSILSVIKATKVEFYNTTYEFEGRLLQGRFNLDFLVVLAETHEDLALLAGLRKILIDHRVILIVPDSLPDTLSFGHSFHPRFLTSVDSRFEDVKAVLQHIQDKQQEAPCYQTDSEKF